MKRRFSVVVDVVVDVVVVVVFVVVVDVDVFSFNDASTFFSFFFAKISFTFKTALKSKSGPALSSASVAK